MSHSTHVRTMLAGLFCCAFIPTAAGQSTTIAAATGEPAAQVGSHVITTADLDREWRRTDPVGFATLSQPVYEARRILLESMIADEVLALEANRRGLSVEGLLKEELPKHVRGVTEDSIVSLYEGLRDRTRGTLDQMRPELRAWLEREALVTARSNYVAELGLTTTRMRVLLEPPRFDIAPVAEDPALGPSTAPVVIFVFGDFLSQGYASAAQTMRRVRDTFGDKVRIVFKNLPPHDQPEAFAAAIAAVCANSQGRFWEYHDRLLASSGDFGAARLRQHAIELGLDRAAFDACMNRGSVPEVIEAAIAEASRYHVTSVPTFVINGRLAAYAPPLEFFKKVIDEELLMQARKSAADRP